ncbi:MAG: GNAT family protein [Actinomycetes bacterium]
MELNSAGFQLITDRLIIRPMTMADEADLFEYQSLPEVVKYIPWPARTLEQVHEALAKSIAESKFDNEGDYGLLGIELASSRKIVGQLALMYRSVENQTAEFGYVLNPKYSGHGYATEACKAAVTYIFETGKFNRIFAHLDARNAASENLVKRLGMRKEAHIEEEEFFKGEWCDAIIYGILKREWLP